jgi:hypothetical protein
MQSEIAVNIYRIFIRGFGGADGIRSVTTERGGSGMAAKLRMTRETAMKWNRC